ncbi:hypothetical protein I545_2111 [Mycobacterium kansasii 662]|uniref:Uncharacterized protein n=1 Tax=Mycobacterium kansasii 662 TaxID=1299326 RepID=X7ZNW5_MYCKA|nr:hypothetical protein I547_3959 [Mycobacterium kansasii 824]EUA20300.1 hypothetical protein I545_2111 [Mycobacterium kansasii 662]KEP40080.1 hypothetical protein MKSMC1_47770 [Mycobacterium kansasii]
MASWTIARTAYSALADIRMLQDCATRLSDDAQREALREGAWQSGTA